jgi:lipoprotein LpqH
MVKRGFVVAVGGAAIVIAGLSGCSSDDEKAESPTTAAKSPTTTAEATTGAGTGGATAAPSGGGTKVLIDGQDQNVSGTVVCSAMGGNMNIAIGEAATGIAAVLSEDGSTVQSVGLGNVNGVTLGYTSGTGQGEATATKDGNTYKITGTATGVGMANPMQPVNKPFEIDVTCP